MTEPVEQTSQAEGPEVTTIQAAAEAVPSQDNPFKDPESAELELRMVKDINNMPEEVKDRFKALKVITD